MVGAGADIGLRGSGPNNELDVDVETVTYVREA